MKVQDWKETFLTQYADSKVLKALASSFADAISITPEWINTNLLNQNTCPTFILEKIAERYGLNATFALDPLTVNHDFIFNSAQDGYAFETPTGDGGTFDIKGTGERKYIKIPKNNFLQVIYMNTQRATLNPSLANLNRLANLIFAGRGKVWLDISRIELFELTWNFDFALTPIEKQLIQNGYLSFLSGYNFLFVDTSGS